MKELTGPISMEELKALRVDYNPELDKHIKEYSLYLRR